MGISVPGQAIPQLPVRDSLDFLDAQNDLWSQSVSSPLYFSGENNILISGDADKPSLLAFSTTSTSTSINLTTTNLVLSWFDYFAVEFSFYVPFFGDAGASVYGIGFTTGAGTPCTTNVSTAQIRFGNGGTSCSGTVDAGKWNVLCGPVSNQVNFNTVHSFDLETWYTGKIEYQKSPKYMQFYINGSELITPIENSTNIPDTQNLTFRMMGNCNVLNFQDYMLVDYVRFITTTSRELA